MTFTLPPPNKGRVENVYLYHTGRRVERSLAPRKPTQVVHIPAAMRCDKDSAQNAK